MFFLVISISVVFAKAVQHCGIVEDVYDIINGNVGCSKMAFSIFFNFLLESLSRFIEI